VIVERLTLRSFRSYESVELTPAPTLTVIRGRNGQGKTNLVEAIAWMASMASFRGATTDVLIRDGDPTATIRLDVDSEGRRLDLVATLDRARPSRVEVNSQKLRRTRDLLGLLRVTVFTPDDLVLIKGGPSERRQILDDLLVSMSPSLDAVRTDLDRVLRQRAVLLKQAGGRLSDETLSTLEVWDAQLVPLATRLAEARMRLVAALSPFLQQTTSALSGRSEIVELRYVPSWLEGGLASALVATRNDDLRRQVTTVGPHRDDVEVLLRGQSSRTHCSQGEQRTLALALRLAGHELVRDRTGSAPVLLLDDVFSELDPLRTQALLDHLPGGQTLLTTAEVIPAGANPAMIVDVADRSLTIAPGTLS
jgi:DNA replication and repair protein RecF